MSNLAPANRTDGDNAVHFDKRLTPESVGALIGFAGVHVAALGAFWSGVSTIAVVLCVSLFWLRMFAIGAGYHRLFAHRAYETSRPFAFILGFLAQTSAQSGLIWWASKHRNHHKHTDQPEDFHSPRQYGFWFSHMGWIWNYEAQQADLSNVPDLTSKPELMWLENNKFLPAIALAIFCFLVGGWSGLFFGFFVSTVLVYHATFTINSMCHVLGKRRYLTGDDSRNNALMAIVTMGEGWHNNHHYYMASVRQGFRWYEWDPTYYILKALSGVGIVWNLREPPAHVLTGDRKVSPVIKDKVAAQLAATFNVERISERLHARLAKLEARMDEKGEAIDEAWEDFKARARTAANQYMERGREAIPRIEWPELPDMPELPTREDVRARAQQMFVGSPAMDDIVDRARELLDRAIVVRAGATA